MFKEGDYVEGFEFYGNTVKKVRGWVDYTREYDNSLVIHIQCDDEFEGHRGNYIYESLGEIKLLEEQKPRPNIY